MTYQKFSYQTKIEENSSIENFLLDFSTLMNKVEKDLYVKLLNKENLLKELKREFLVKYQISARHFNSVYKILVGKINSLKEIRKLRIDEVKGRIKSLEKYVKNIEKQKKVISKKKKNALHQKKRKLISNGIKLARLMDDKENDTSRICFGSKKLFKKQFNLEKNNYSNHSEWKEDWVNARRSQFTLVGSKDETTGNQNCIATVNDDGTLNLKLKVPDALTKKYNNFININNVQLHYGKDNILAALKDNELRRELSLKNSTNIHGDKYKLYGRALTYKFKWDYKKNKWYIHISVGVEEAKTEVYEGIGAIGVDINVNHLAITETDATGNPIKSFSIPTNTYGKKTEQAKAIIGDACKELISYSLKSSKPIVIEDLDFKKKKTTLKEQSNKYARMLSSFSYNLITTFIKSRAFRYGSKVHTVNPAFSSVIGRVKFSKMYGLSIHHGAALVLARRYQKFSERLPKSLSNIPDGFGGHVALSQTVSIADKHLWHLWGKIFGKLKAVLAEQYKEYRHKKHVSYAR